MTVSDPEKYPTRIYIETPEEIKRVDCDDFMLIAISAEDHIFYSRYETSTELRELLDAAHGGVAETLADETV